MENTIINEAISFLTADFERMDAQQQPQNVLADKSGKEGRRQRLTYQLYSYEGF